MAAVYSEAAAAASPRDAIPNAAKTPKNGRKRLEKTKKSDSAEERNRRI